MAKAKTAAEKVAATAAPAAATEKAAEKPAVEKQHANTTLTVGGKAVSVVEGVARKSDLKKKIGVKKEKKEE